jgi:hypothetical protein
VYQDAPVRRTDVWAGAVLARGGVAAAGLVVATALSAAVLVPLHAWYGWLAVPLAVAALAVAVVGAARLVPAPPAPAWTAGAVVAIAAGHGVWAALTRAEHVVLRRDAGSYAQFTEWIRGHHALPVDASLDAFGGSAALADPAFRLSSPAFYEIVHGTPGAAGSSAEILPQFFLGAPAWFSLGGWTGGWTGLLVAPAVASALALLAFAGLAARLVGPRWAVLATGVLALAQPVLHAARSTYSEPLALLLVCAAGALLVDAVRAGNPAAAGADGGDDRSADARRLALAAGLAAGLAGLVRVDALREVVLLLPVAAVLARRGHPAARPLVTGALGGLAVAAVPAVLLGYRYLGDIAASLVPLAVGGVLLGGLSLWLARGRPALRVPLPAGLGDALRNRSPLVAGGAVLVLGALLASRPLWLTARQSATDPGARVVADLQADQGLPVDGGRTYAEHSLDWVGWYLGPVAVVVAWLAFAVLAARAVAWWRDGAGGEHDGRDVPPWLAPAFVGLGSAVLTLYRPGITPDHPWADRRLVPVVLPLFVLAAVAAAAWATRALRPPAAPHTRAAALRRTWPAARPAVVALAVAGLAGPAWLGTAAVAGAETERGELAAVRTVCDRLRDGDVVVALDARGANEWPQVVRGMCGNPAASVQVVGARDESTAAVASVEPARRIAQRIAAAGHRPVLLAAEQQGLATMVRLGLQPEPAVRLDTTEDQRWLTRRPDGVTPLAVDVWLAPWPTGTP